MSFTRGLRDVSAAQVLLTVSAAALAAEDTLDVYLQSSDDGGTTWDDFVHFTQVLGNGGAKKHVANWSGIVAPESEMHAVADAAMSAGVKQGPVGELWRIKWVIVGETASFTFTMDGSFNRLAA